MLQPVKYAETLNFIYCIHDLLSHTLHLRFSVACIRQKELKNNAKENLKDRKYQGLRIREENKLNLSNSEAKRKVDEKC